MQWLGILNAFLHPLSLTILHVSIYAAAGWMLEVVYRSWNQKHFVNAGFLRGPFLPIYGIGALCVLLLAPYLRSAGMVWEFIGFGIVLTTMEYAVGTVCERYFGLRMWDYSDSRFNLHGRVCLTFSALWAGLAVGFERVLHPAVARWTQQLDPNLVHTLAPLLLLYFLLDFAHSVNLLRLFVANLSRIHLRHLHPDLHRLEEPFKRLLTAFPILRKYIEGVNGLRDRIDDRRWALQARFLGFVESRSPREEEFRRFVREIAVHPEFLRTKEFLHHDSSIFRHALRVSFQSYRLGKFLHLDARAMARGGLLHDFFLYDWRNHDLPELAREKFHGLEHPRIALENTSKHFTTTALERDIIVKHMWPLTWLPPRHLESFLVGCVDKLVALREFRALHLARKSNSSTL